MQPDLMRFRGVLMNNTSLSRAETIDSPLEPFFNIAHDVKSEISRVETAFDALQRKQSECLRPTFLDSSDVMNEINNLTNSINVRLQMISQKIGCIVLDRLEAEKFPERAKILSNIRANLNEAYKDFSIRFKMEQENFSASFNRAPHLMSDKEDNANDDFIELDVGNENYQRRQQQLMQEQNDEEIQQIIQRAEEIRGIFVDLSNLIAEQGTVIDRIDFCVTESLNNAKEAHKEVEKAAKYQKKSRMWICAAILAVMIVILIIMAILK